MHLNQTQYVDAKGPQKETKPFYPRSPYAVAKLYAYWIKVNFREASSTPATGSCSITRAPRAAKPSSRARSPALSPASRSGCKTACTWATCRHCAIGTTPANIEMQWLMLLQQRAEDFVIVTGVRVSVREFVQRAAAELGITVAFSGEGTQEVGTVATVSGDKAQCKVWDMIVRVDPRYFRPTEVETLLGDAGKAKRKLGWTPVPTLAELVCKMVKSDYVAAKRDSLVRQAGYQAFNSYE